MRYLLAGDVHLSDRPPSSCTETYTEDLLALLQQMSSLASEKSCSAVILAGDLWHHKAPVRTSHRLVQTVIRLFRDFPCPVFVVPGNHDIQNDRLDSVHVTQPLGVLFESGAARLLEGWSGFPIGERPDPLFGVPWQQDWSEDVISEILADYREVAQSWAALPPGERGTVPTHHLVVTHAPIYPPGHELPWENTPASWWAEAMGRLGSVFYGHVHEPHGVYRVNDVAFCNNGALSRGSLHEYNLTRDLHATVWDAETGEFEAVKLKARPAEEVFRLREKERAVDSEEVLADFLASIRPSQVQVMSVESVIEDIKKQNIDPDVKDIAIELLSDAQHGGK